MSTNDWVWLSPQGFQEARTELDRLLLSQRCAPGQHEGNVDAQAWARHEWRERRIRHLQELLLTAEVGGAPPDDGIAEAGMVLTVRFDDSSDIETFLLADAAAPNDAQMDVYSSASPIGRAMTGAREGDTCTCRLPDGHTISITLLVAKPYQPHTPVLE